MIKHRLPVSIKIDGMELPITERGNWSLVLDIISVLNDPDFDESERAYVALKLFYGNIPDCDEEILKKLIEEMLIFINCGNPIEKHDEKPVIMNWEQDFDLIIPPINKVLGKEVRTDGEYTHWWTFVGAYNEIGECAFCDIVSIRRKRQRGERLTKDEQRFFNEFSDKIILKRMLSQEDIDFLNDDSY